MPRGVKGFQRRSCRFQPAPHFRPWDEARLLKRHTSATQHHKVGDRLYAEARRRLRAVLRVHFQNQCPARHFASEGMNLRRGHSAGSAPRRPEIGQNRHARLGDDLREGVIVDIQRFVHRRQRRFAGAASASIGKMCRRDAVPFSATWTFSDHGECQITCPPTPAPFRRKDRACVPAIRRRY
jgi:hypothetical protein